MRISTIFHRDRKGTGSRAENREGDKAGSRASDRTRSWMEQAGILLFWLAVWAGLALAVGNKLILASPWEAGAEFLRLLTESSFYMAVGNSLLRIALGFLGGLGAALFLAVESSRHPFLEKLLEPFMSLIKAVPVASFVVLLLLWWGADFLSTAICFLIVLPNLYISTLEGLKSTDRRLLEMAEVFGMSYGNRFLYIYRPGLRPFLCGSLKVALGMCWKSGVAAEVIAVPDATIGEQLYLSKIYLDTAGLFAWTTAIICLSVCFERLVLYLAERFFEWRPEKAAEGRRGKRTEGEAPGGIRLERVTKRFGDVEVLKDVTEEYPTGRVSLLTTPSGSGKTTRLLLAAGVLTPDGGRVQRPGRVSMAFQEDRLCEEETAVRNVALVTGDREKARRALLRVLPAGALDKPCGQLSGGQKRRVAVVRAMEAASGAVLLDEPYGGLDPESRKRTAEYIRESCRGRAVVIATHIAEE